MQRIPLDRSQVQCLDLFRVALSEPDMPSRLSAISTIKLQVQSEFVLQYLDTRRVDHPWGPGDLEELAAIAEAEKARLGAARDSAELFRRYDGGKKSRQRAQAECGRTDRQDDPAVGEGREVLRRA